MVNFPTRILDCDSYSPALLDFFLSFDSSICFTMAFPPLGNSDHGVVSVSIDFPINSKRDALFHCIAYDYSRADWHGLVIIWDVPWEDIFKGYLCYKTITSQNVSSEAQIKNFFISLKNYVPFSRYSSFSIFNHAIIYQICDITMSISTWDKVHVWMYLLNHNSSSHQTWPIDRYKQWPF